MKSSARRIDPVSATGVAKPMSCYKNTVILVATSSAYAIYENSRCPHDANSSQLLAQDHTQFHKLS
jgi:hypothetical protein